MKVFYLLLLLFLVSCNQEQEHTLKVAATVAPHAQMLEIAKEELAKEGIHLKIIVVEDYQTPNRALADGEIDANFFQHEPFLEEQIKKFHYPITSAGKIHIEPMGAYSTKLHSIHDLQNGATVTLPLDPSNQARALLLLQKNHLITLDSSITPNLLNIVQNSKALHFTEVDAALLPRTLEDTDLALIPTNYALQAALNPTRDALLLEDADSPYANVVAVRIGDANRADIRALVAALKSEKVREYLKRYDDAIILETAVEDDNFGDRLKQIEGAI